MPNWVTNKIRIEGPDERVEELRNLLLVDDPETEGGLSVTFRKIIPRPEILSRTVSGGNVSLGLFALGYDDVKKSEAVKLAQQMMGSETPLDYPWVKKEGIETREQLKSWLEENRPSAIEEAKISIKAIEETGFADWYDWSLAHWGTKWDPSHSVVLTDSFETPGLLEVRFDTAWSTPAPVLQAICEKFPDLDMKGWHLDEMPNFAEVSGSDPGESDLMMAEVDVSTRQGIAPIHSEIYGEEPAFDEFEDEDFSPPTMN